MNRHFDRAMRLPFNVKRGTLKQRAWAEDILLRPLEELEHCIDIARQIPCYGTAYQKEIYSLALDMYTAQLENILAAGGDLEDARYVIEHRDAFQRIGRNILKEAKRLYGFNPAEGYQI